MSGLNQDCRFINSLDECVSQSQQRPLANGRGTTSSLSRQNSQQSFHRAFTGLLCCWCTIWVLIIHQRGKKDTDRRWIFGEKVIVTPSGGLSQELQARRRYSQRTREISQRFWTSIMIWTRVIFHSQVLNLHTWGEIQWCWLTWIMGNNKKEDHKGAVYNYKILIRYKTHGDEGWIGHEGMKYIPEEAWFLFGWEGTVQACGYI